MENKKLYVGNLNYDTTGDRLKELFSTYGTVDQVNIIERKGFGFVEMSTPEEAGKAKAGLNDSELDGRKIKVDIAQPKKPRSDSQGGGFSRGGGYGNRGFSGGSSRGNY